MENGTIRNFPSNKKGSIYKKRNILEVRDLRNRPAKIRIHYTKGVNGMTENEKVGEIRSLSEEIVKALLKDGYKENGKDLKEAVELLSRTVYDLSTVYLNKENNNEETLKGTLAKIQISFNAVQKERLLS